jgi:hypothetical protein
MNNVDELVNGYLEAFNETEPQRRRELVAQLYTDDSAYVDPLVELRGASQIEAFIDQTQAQFPGYAFTLGSAIDAHHDQARFNWHATAPGESEPAYVGFDVLVTDDGRIRTVYGFLDKVPAA